ncbi:hypothetical protein [Micromonospora zhanjiangensis]|uniref:Uncharacterized protein n=1 Tax=Micromonospora zhanjiangensis TaxID=1522057 RepID=A0ABV8KGC6_9ACTN
MAWRRSGRGAPLSRPVADEVSELHVELASAREEASRLRFALHEWRAGFPYGNERFTGYDRKRRSDIVPRQPRRYGGA